MHVLSPICENKVTNIGWVSQPGVGELSADIYIVTIHYLSPALVINCYLASIKGVLHLPELVDHTGHFKGIVVRKSFTLEHSENNTRYSKEI